MMKKILMVLLLIWFVSICPYYNAKSASFSDLDSDLYKENIEAVQVFSVNDKDIIVSDKDVYLMAQIVYAESRSEPYEGKIAVASVILNRLKSPGFPKSIEQVIKQKGAFSCLKDGQISVIPDDLSYCAVLDALKGVDPTDSAVFYYNPKISTSKWMKNIGKKNVKSIGNHVFFVVNK